MEQLDVPNLVIFPLCHWNKGVAYLPNSPTHSNWPIMVIVLFLISPISIRFHFAIFHIFLFSMCHPSFLFFNFSIFHYFVLFPIFVLCNFPSFLLFYFQFSNFSMFPFSPHYVLIKSCLLCLIQTVIKIVQYGNCLISHFHNFNLFPVFWFSMCPCFLFPILKI